MYKTALWAGINYPQIENLSPYEINFTAQIKADSQKEHYKTLAWIAYNQASLTAIAINAPKKFPKIEDAFPTLFERKEQQDWWVMKQRVEEFARVKSEKS